MRASRTFAHEWILEAFAAHTTVFTKRMFGGLAAYVFERQMLVLVEPTKTGRWKWDGCWWVLTTDITPPSRRSSLRCVRMRF